MPAQLPGADIFIGADDEFDGGTDSDTASSLGEREYDFQTSVTWIQHIRNRSCFGHTSALRDDGANS
eukprot:937490-Lingulodinium_polyedra.AAC.1